MIMMYENISALIRESYKFLEKIGWFKNKIALVQNNRILISLKANEDSQSSDEWVGFIQTIKKILKTSNMKMVDEVANQSDKLEKKITAQTEKINSQQESL